MKQMEIRSQSDISVRKKIAKTKVAIIPIGSIEQHGPHLPLSTDSDIATEIARQIADKRGYLLMPAITTGVSFEHAPYFNLSIRESTLQTVLKDLCLSLKANGIRTVFIINGHHGNNKPVKNLERKMSQEKGLKVFTFSYWHFMKRDFDHAGFVETSLMLAISKNVKMKHAKKGLITKNLTKQQIKEVKKLALKSFPKATGNGIWGDPRNATRKDGKKILDEIVKNLQKKCQTCLAGNGSKLHQ